MTSKVFVRFINENQWVSLCNSHQADEALDVPEDLFVEWCSAEQDSNLSESSIVSFAEFVDQLHNQWSHTYQFGVDLVISGSNAITTEVTIPSKQMRHVAQALPYMLEDQLAQDVSLLHLVTGSRGAEGQVPVMAVPKNLIEATKVLFDQFDLPLDAIVPDMLCLPKGDNEWTLLIDGKQMMVKMGELAGMSIEMDAAPVVLNSLMDSSSQKPSILRVFLCQPQLNENLQNWIKTQITGAVADQELDLEFEEIESSEFTLICDQLHRGSMKKRVENILQGKFASSGRRKPNTFNWKPLAALVATFVLLHTVFLHTQAWQINQEVDRLDAESKTLYKRLFPRDKRIVNVKRQMEQHIKSAQQGGGGQDFMSLLALTGEQIHQINREQINAITPRRVAFDEGQGDLRLDLMVKDFKQLEDFKTRLQQASLTVETASATQDKGVVKARLKIRSARS